MASQRIAELRDRIELFSNSLFIYVRNIVINSEEIIVEMNAEKQLYNMGITSLGIDINSFAPYKEFTIKKKKEKGQPTDRVTLRDTEDFHKSFFVDAKEEEFEIKAGDWKTERLILRYGDEIMGLTGENLTTLIWQHIYPYICEQRDNLIKNGYTEN